jgi:sugar phosphate permease
MLAGLALTGAALLAMVTIGAHTAYLLIAVLLAFSGFGQGLAIPATMAAALETCPENARASGRQP